MNILVSISITLLKKDTFFYHFNWFSLVVWDFVLIFMSLKDPGIASKNPYIHTEEYLRHIQMKDLGFRICKDCKLIQRDIASSHTKSGTFHCPWCDVCVEGHDNHFKWIGKCIGVRNSSCFTILVFLYFL